MFYLEENFLKYGKKGKPISYQIDLSEAMVERPDDSNTKLRIYFNGEKLGLKAETNKEREEWIEALGNIPKKSNHQAYIETISF